MQISVWGENGQLIIRFPLIFYSENEPTCLKHWKATFREAENLYLVHMTYYEGMSSKVHEVKDQTYLVAIVPAFVNELTNDFLTLLGKQLNIHS